MICNQYPACSRPGRTCRCNGLISRIFEAQRLEDAQRRAKDWHQWAERHGYLHTGYVNGKPHLVKAQVRA